MTLIKSISGIRGTIGGVPGDNLTPLDVVKFTCAYGTMLRRSRGDKRLSVVTGRDARISGAMVNQLVGASLAGLGIDVIDLGLATTPAVEMAVTHYQADGGIILTASHNPGQWNALKLLNHKGEFISASDGAELLRLAASDNFTFAPVDQLGNLRIISDFNQIHIDKILSLPYVDVAAIRKAGFRIAVDGVNSVGGTAIPALLRALGVAEVIELYCTPNGIFPHNPEPLPEHLTELSALVKSTGAQLGFVVDPDVDRLAVVTETGDMFGEEYTLVAVADYLLSIKPGNTVSNLSSTRALSDVTGRYGGRYFAAAVGEVNVVEKMKAVGAVIGGEGNGGVILPDLHYGRDALVGVALFLTLLARKGGTCSQLRATYPDYFMSKNKVELTPATDIDGLLARVKAHYSHEQVNDIDGVKIDFAEGWVHLRKSNTEPIIRIYSEGSSPEKASELAQQVMKIIG